MSPIVPIAAIAIAVFAIRKKKRRTTQGTWTWIEPDEQRAPDEWPRIVEANRYASAQWWIWEHDPGGPYSYQYKIGDTSSSYGPFDTKDEAKYRLMDELKALTRG